MRISTSVVILAAAASISPVEPERINKIDCVSGPCINICERTVDFADRTSGLNLSDVEFAADQITPKKLLCRTKPQRLKAKLHWEVSANGVLETTFPVYGENYCVNRTDGSLLVCDVCDYESCVRMCDRELELEEVIVQGVTFKHYKKHFPCSHTIIVDDFQVLPSGIIRTDVNHFGLSEYCLHLNGTLHVCKNEAFPEKPKTVVSILALILLCCSIPCLVVTIVLYIKMKGFDHTHNKFIVCYFVSLTLFFVTLLTVKRNWLHGHPIPCNLLALIHYYVVLTAFCWLFAMAFGKFHAVLNNERLSKSICREHCSCRKKFIWNCCFCYGIPAVVVAVLATLLLTTRFRISQFFCGFSFKHEFLIFVPITIATVLTMGIYVVIANKLLIIHRNIIKNTEMANSASLLNSSTEPSNKYQTRPVVRIAGTLIDKEVFKQEKLMVWAQFRLFLIMGVFWISEAITFWLGSTDYLTITLDLINCSQGIIIFCLFGWDRKLLKDFRAKLRNYFDLMANKWTR